MTANDGPPRVVVAFLVMCVVLAVLLFVVCISVLCATLFHRVLPPTTVVTPLPYTRHDTRVDARLDDTRQPSPIPSLCIDRVSTNASASVSSIDNEGVSVGRFGPHPDTSIADNTQQKTQLKSSHHTTEVKTTVVVPCGAYSSAAADTPVAARRATLAAASAVNQMAQRIRTLIHDIEAIQPKIGHVSHDNNNLVLRMRRLACFANQDDAYRICELFHERGWAVDNYSRRAFNAAHNYSDLGREDIIYPVALQTAAAILASPIGHKLIDLEFLKRNMLLMASKMDPLQFQRDNPSNNSSAISMQARTLTKSDFLRCLAGELHPDDARSHSWGVHIGPDSNTLFGAIVSVVRHLRLFHPSTAREMLNGVTHLVFATQENDGSDSYGRAHGGGGRFVTSETGMVLFPEVYDTSAVRVVASGTLIVAVRDMAPHQIQVSGDSIELQVL